MLGLFEDRGQGHMKRLRWRLILVMVLAAMLCQDRPTAHAADEYPVKAAFISHFAEFVEWPSDAFADSKAPLAIGILGADPFHGALEKAVAGKTVSGHPLVVRHFSSIDDLEPCQILFVASECQDDFATAQQRMGNRSVLTVGEWESFPSMGGVIRLFTENNHIRFDINRGAAERARLRISAKLLKLARAILN